LILENLLIVVLCLVEVCVVVLVAQLVSYGWMLEVGCFLRALCDSFATSYAKASAPKKGFGARGP